ncbi:vacuolar protein sorting-associated protein 27 [Moniliophthora roreri MCA 2997]|uniref:Vacuolar protein sorting-associated protein 27 n=1 Tax=Moniliophthora roreri (strain MCA 2997) TaxID=1381753 RepID=V2XZ57_MONRO|nr:vacuolar protein sorting-associated protein 27 [Moniliophthora roreri MCA 2997]
MSTFSSWLWGTSQLDDAIDKATSELRPAGSEDIALNLEICDQIRSKSAQAKDAMRSLKRRLNHKNPNVQLLALKLTDTCVKNGGDHFLVEIGSREFIDNLASILRMPTLNHEVKATILRLIQNWSVAFEGKPSLSYVGTIYKTLKSEGFDFPPKDMTAANSLMVDTSTAPEWIDSEVCLRCRTPFTFTNRKHHCRNCGQVFDQQCSSKSLPLPHFGITQEVRVCDGCYNKLSKRGEKSDKGHRHSSSMHSSRHRSAQDLADAELQRAIQLSLQEVGAAGGHSRPGWVPSQPTGYSEPPLVERSSRPNSRSEEEDDPDLKAAIEASLREANAPKASAPVAVETPRAEEASVSYNGPGYSQSYPPTLSPHPTLPKIPNYDLEPLEEDAILTFSQTVDQVQAQGGGDISRYPAVTQLYDKANSLRPKLALNLDDAGRKEQILSDMHDKLSQAVKLYDQLLSQQVAQPRWRSPPASATPYQQPTQTGYAAINGHSQWTQNGYQEPTQGQMTPSQSSYPERDAQTPTPQSQPWYNKSPQPQPQQYLQSTAQHTPISVSQPQYAQYAPQQPQAATSTPYHATSPPPQSPVTSHTPASFAVLHPQQSQPVAHSPTLSRQNTISYSQQHASVPPTSPTLSRSHTISHPPTQQREQPQHYYQSQTPQQQQHYHPQPQKQSQPQPQPQYLPSSPPSAPSVTSLAQFPVAPTSAPQSFPMYGSTVGLPTGVAQTEERKEALLIDL